MGWLGFWCFVVLAVGFFACGLLVASRSKKRRVLWTLAFLLPLLASTLLRHSPMLEARLFDPGVYAYLRPWTMYLFGLGFLGVAVPQVERLRDRAALSLFAAVIFGFGTLVRGAGAHLDPNTLTGVVHSDSRVCAQSSTFSCGAAAATTFLECLGIPASEAEMARRCLTNPMAGTDEFGVLKGLKEKLNSSPYDVRLVEVEARELRTIQAPMMVSIRLSTFVGHWVVVLAHDDVGLTIGDSMNVTSSKDQGVQQISWESFDDMFDGLAVEVVAGPSSLQSTP